MASAGDVITSDPLLDVSLTACPMVSQADLDRLVALELNARAIAAATRATAHAEIRCAGDTAHLTVTSGANHFATERTVPLAGMSTVGRARLLAVAVAEMLASTPAPATEDGPTPAMPVEALPPPPPPSKTPARELWAALGGEAAGAPTHLAAAAELGLAFVSTRWVWGGDARASAGSQAASLGSVSSRALSLGARVGANATRAPWRVQAGLGVRAGCVWMSGHPRQPDLVRGSAVALPFAGPFGWASAAWLVNAHWRVGAAVDVAAYALRAAGLVDERPEVLPLKLNAAAMLWVGRGLR